MQSTNSEYGSPYSDFFFFFFLNKVIVKVILLHKISILNKFCYFELFHSSKNPVSKVKKKH